MVWRRRALAAFVFGSWALAVACGRTAPDENGGDDSVAIDAASETSKTPTTDATTTADAARIFDATVSADALRPQACIPGQSVACVGPGACSTNQICNGDGTGFGACTCLPPIDASISACVPGASIACAGAGGCISNQICNDFGTGYGACVCENDAGTLSCIPGQSIACGGPFACASFQVCDEDGTAYLPCDCPDGGHYDFRDGGLPDGYAPLPPPVGDQGYNAIWIESSSIALAPLNRAIFLPLFSAPDCNVVPPYGAAYSVSFQPNSAGPAGAFPACSQSTTNPNPCYQPQQFVTPGLLNYEEVPGGMYTLSNFDSNGIATGQMNTTEGIVPLVVKNCQ